MALIVACVCLCVLGLGCLAAMVLNILFGRRPDQRFAQVMVSCALTAFENGLQRGHGLEPGAVSSYLPATEEVRRSEPGTAGRPGIVDPEEEDVPVEPGAFPR